MAQRTFVTIKDQVYQSLKEDICSGKYPPGYRMQEIDLATELSVSRTPVREALKQLVYDGLVVEIPNRGTYVREFTPRDVEEIYNMRLLLEGYAFDSIRGVPSAEDAAPLRAALENMEAAYARRDLAGYIQWDTAMHELYIAMAHDHMLTMVYSRVQVMVQQFRAHALSSRTRFEDSIAEHRETAELLLSGDSAKAREINRRHLELAREEILRAISR